MSLLFSGIHSHVLCPLGEVWVFVCGDNQTQGPVFSSFPVSTDAEQLQFKKKIVNLIKLKKLIPVVDK